MVASISHFLTTAIKFSCCSSNKKCLLCFLSLALALCRSFSRWASLACRLLSLFSISAFRFRLYRLSSCLCFTRRGRLCDFLPNNLELHLGCHTCLLIYFTLACLWCGRTGGRTVTWLPKFLGRVDYYYYARAWSLCITNLKIADSFFKKKMGIIVAIKSQHYLSTFCPTAKLHIPGIFLKTGLNK